jgi:hypothetical protein
MVKPLKPTSLHQFGMLAGHDVFEVEGFQRWPRIRQPTVFAAPRGPLANSRSDVIPGHSGPLPCWRSAFRRSVASRSLSSMKRSYSPASSELSWPSLAFCASKSNRALAVGSSRSSPSARTLLASRHRATDSSRLSSTPNSGELRFTGTAYHRPRPAQGGFQLAREMLEHSANTDAPGCTQP